MTLYSGQDVTVSAWAEARRFTPLAGKGKEQKTWLGASSSLVRAMSRGRTVPALHGDLCTFRYAVPDGVVGVDVEDVGRVEREVASAPGRAA